MSTAMIGQLSALDLLAPPPPPKREPTAWVTPPPCEACGGNGLYDWIHPLDSQRFGHPVCIGMNLTLNHIHHGMGRAGGKWDETIPCCHGKGTLHGKTINKPTRDQWLDHARLDIERAKVKWANYLPSLIKAVGDLRHEYGVAKDEAPVFDDPEPKD